MAIILFPVVSCDQSFNGVSHNVRSNEKSDIVCFNVPQVNVGETSRFEVFPRCSGDDASVPKKEPHAFEHMLEEVRPRWWIWNDVFQKVESPSLQDRAKTNRFHHGAVTNSGCDFYFYFFQLLLECTETMETGSFCSDLTFRLSKDGGWKF